MMRKLFMIVSVVMASCSSSTELEIQENEVPPGIMNAFKAKYPQAHDVSWEAEKEDGKFYFEADFKDGDKEKEVHISPDGSLITEGD
jgi:hypothetical protein